MLDVGEAAVGELRYILPVWLVVRAGAGVTVRVKVGVRVRVTVRTKV